MNKDQRVTGWDVSYMSNVLWSKAEASKDHQWALLAAHEAGRMSMLRGIMRDGDSDWARVVAYRSARDFMTEMEEEAS